MAFGFRGMPALSFGLLVSQSTVAVCGVDSRGQAESHTNAL
jgi:hypothetical protein